MRERDIGRVVRPLLFASVLPIFASCSEQPMEATYTTNAYVHTLEDKANPLQSSGELMFLNIPDWVIGEPQKMLRVPLSSFFYASCDARKVIGKDKIDLGSPTQDWSAEGEEVMYVRPTENNNNSTRDKREYKVNKKQWNDLIREVTLKIRDRVIKRSSVSDQQSGILGTSEVVRAAQLPLGESKVICSFETWSGRTYTSEAAVEIKDDRT